MTSSSSGSDFPTAMDLVVANAYLAVQYEPSEEEKRALTFANVDVLERHQQRVVYYSLLMRGWVKPGFFPALHLTNAGLQAAIAIVQKGD